MQETRTLPTSSTSSMRRSPPAFPVGSCRSPDAQQPLQRHPPCTCAGCPDRAVPRARGATGGQREEAPRAFPGGVLPRERR
jgi:hypothetical protein